MWCAIQGLLISLTGSRRPSDAYLAAPAGAGKSTLVGEWRESANGLGTRFAWLSLDDADSDPVRFFTYFAAALDEIRPGIGEAAESLFRSTNLGAQRTEILTALINEMAEIEDDFVLGLDDYHVITDEQVHGMMATLVEQMPSQMHLLIATRHDPSLPLARLRARGALTEIRGPELQFGTAETATMLSASEDLEIPETLLADLTERTEGWAAGLHLFALSVRGRTMSASELKQRVDSFTGGQRFVFDYLAGEIFDQCDVPTREFLVNTSLLDRMTGSLCDRVTGGNGSREILAQLAEQNLFLIPLDDEREWFRYHHLFQDFLRSRTDGLSLLEAEEARNRASAWFEENEMPAEALEPAYSAGDHETVARLLAANFEEFQRIGHYTSISRWAESLPDAMVKNRPRLALIYAVGVMLAKHDLEAVHRLGDWANDAINAIERNGDFDPRDDIHGTVVGPEGLDTLKGELLALRFFHSGWTLPPGEATKIGQAALRLLPAEKHHARGLIYLIDAEIQLGVAEMKSMLPLLEKGV